MALYATNRFPGDGTTTSYEFNFVGKYIARHHVKVYQEDNATKVRTPVAITDSNFLNDTTLRNLPVTPAGKTLVIYRDTPKPPLVDFTNGSRFTEFNMDLVARQGLFVALEAMDEGDIDAREQLLAAIAVVTGLVDDATTAVSGATAEALAAAASAATAQGAATLATSAKTAAEAANTSAQTARTDAQASASAASTSASNAASSASTANTQAGLAGGYAVSANTQATNAANSAATATTQAGIAATKASEAAASAAASAAPADGSITDAKVFAPSTPAQAIKSNKLSYLRTATNATHRWVNDKLSDITSVKDWGAVGDGSTDDTAAIQAAVNYLNSQGGGQLFFPRGIYITSGVTVYTNIWLVGEGRSITTLRMKNGANNDVVVGYNAYTLFGTNSGGGVQNVGLFNLTIDGNRANNLTSGTGISLYGEEFYFENLSVTQTRGHGIRTEWGRGDSVFGMESHYSNIRIDGCGMDGWNNNGPHDSVTFNLIVIDASLNADRTSHGLVIGPNMTGRFVSCHVWNRAASFRHGWALRISAGGGGNEFIGCHFEGAWLGNAGIFCSNNTFDPTCQFYSAWNGTNVYLGETATFNVIKGRLGSPGAGRPNSVGVALGGAGSDWVANNDIDVFSLDQQGGAISFVNSSGNNKVTVRGYQTSGAVVVGNPKGADIVDVRVSLADVPFVCSNIIQSGTVFIGAGAGATFTFPFPFGTAPHVTFSPSGPSGSITTGVWISATSASSVSFFNNNPVSMTLHVIARRSN